MVNDAVFRTTGAAFIKSATAHLKRLRVGGVPEHFNTPWHTVRRSVLQ